MVYDIKYFMLALCMQCVNHICCVLCLQLQVTLSTHDVGGVSDNDVRMAKFIEAAAKFV